MFKDFLDMHGVKSQANFVEYGYGQVEPNHLSAQRTGQIYAQLPADAEIEMLEQGQFVKYDYAAGGDGIGRVNFDGIGEWMLVYNETKLYRDNQHDCEFAMIKDNYQARMYSPLAEDTNFDAQSRYYGAKDAEGNDIDFPVAANGDYYEPYYNNDPFHIESQYKPQAMPANTQMVPRVFKTNVGDIMTTNTLKVAEDDGEVVMPVIGDVFTPGEKGILEKTTTEAAAGKMLWQVAKVYTMPDHQRGVKLVRVQ